MRSFATLRSLLQLLSFLILGLASIQTNAEGLVDTLVRRFTQSDFEFLRADTNAPYLPIAWVTATDYQQGTFGPFVDNAAEISFHQSSVSQGAFVPIPLGKRDAFVIGEWLSLTHFELDAANRDDLDVVSAAIPIGWIRQSSRNWQLAGFVAPMGHKTHEASWYWETLGGVFARYTSSDRVAWIFGAYADVSPIENFYTPYLGATFVVNERWTINAVMPWPAVTYAPNTDTVFRLGVAPSGASWTIERDERRPRMSLSAWNLGLAIERRLYKNWWIGCEVGVSGLRGLSLMDSHWEGVETKLDNTGFALITLNARPSPGSTNR